jgi:hypothetical protein
MLYWAGMRISAVSVVVVVVVQDRQLCSADGEVARADFQVHTPYPICTIPGNPKYPVSCPVRGIRYLVGRFSCLH